MNKLISKLVEDYISFNPSVLVDKDKPKHKLPQDITDTLLEEHYKLVDDIKILWNDLSVYTLKEVKERKYGWPLAINLFDNKYLYLLFISTMMVGKEEKQHQKVLTLVESRQHISKNIVRRQILFTMMGGSCLV